MRKTSTVLAVLVAVGVIAAGAYWYKQQPASTPVVVEPTATTTESTSTEKVIKPKTPNSMVSGNEWLPASALLTTRKSSSEGTWYWIKNGKLFCMDTPVSADLATFQFSPHGGEYGRDENHAYRCNELLPGVDAASFMVLDSEYSKDRLHGYGYFASIIPGADAASFAAVPLANAELDRSGYAKDKDHVYDGSKIVIGADPATFKMITDYAAADKNQIYINGEAFGPISLILPQYAERLPAACTGTFPEVFPKLIPSIYSKDLLTVGYEGFGSLCVIDRDTNKAEFYTFNAKMEGEFKLSDDGSKIYYHHYCAYEGDGGPTVCDPDEGDYVLDRATGTRVRI